MNFTKHWAATLDDYAIDLAWSPDGKFLAAASAAGAVTLCDAAGNVVHQLAGHDNGTNCLAWPPVGGAFLSAIASATAERPDESRDKPAPTLLATGGQDGKVKFWNCEDGTLFCSKFVGDGEGWVEHIAWLPKSPVILAASSSRTLAFLPALKNQYGSSTETPKTITALAYHPHDGRIAAAYFGGVSLWPKEEFSTPLVLPYGNTIHALTWSPDGRWLVAGCQDNAVHLWAPAEDLELHMSGYETKLKELSFSRDSKWLATGGGRDACVWDCTGAGPEGREPLLLPHSARVIAVAFQNQHGLLATGAADGEFCLWSPSRKNPLIAEVKMPAAATKFAWTPDDSLLAVGTEKGSVFVFKIQQ